MSASTIIHRTLVALACFTTLGILVHDTKFDKALSLALPAIAMSYASAHALGSMENAHTHVERGAFASTQVAGMPRMQPRDDTRRYQLSKYLSRTNTQFGNGSALLWPSV